jgi:hypothetical protein
MDTDGPAFERELRDLFATVPPPAAPASWGPAAGGAGDRSRPRLLRPHRLRLGLAATAALALAATAVLAATHRQPLPSSAVTVAARPGATDLRCSLPISALNGNEATGFIVVDHGHATFRPVRTDGTTYVPATDRWVPVLPQMVAPDGLSYVRQEAAGKPHPTVTVHVVGQSGDRVVLRTGQPVNVFAYTGSGILLVDEEPSAGSGPAEPAPVLELLDPATGSVRPLPHQPPPPMVRGAGASATMAFSRAGDAVWLTGFDPATNAATLRRFDLASGALTEWFDGRTDGTGHLEMVGADQAGLPIVQRSDRDLFHTDPARRAGIAVQTILLAAPHRATVLNQGRVGAPGVVGSLSPLSVNDGDRVWLAADDGTIWSYQAATGMREVARVTTSTAGPPGVAISGPCQ